VKQTKLKLNGKNRGASLIELLVAVLILGTALLTLASLQSRSLQFNQSAYFRSQANILAYDILDRIRINRAKASDYDLAITASAPTGTTLRDKDLKGWLDAIAVMLPDGDGTVDCDANNKCTVSILWTEQLSSSTNDNETMTFTYSSQI
jgi:type IV pilus assembly protein PilV